MQLLGMGPGTWASVRHLAGQLTVCLTGQRPFGGSSGRLARFGVLSLSAGVCGLVCKWEPAAVPNPRLHCDSCSGEVKPNRTRRGPLPPRPSCCGESVSGDTVLLMSVFVEKLTIPLMSGSKSGGPVDVPSPSMAGHIGLWDTSSSTRENGIREGTIPSAQGTFPSRSTRDSLASLLAVLHVSPLPWSGQTPALKGSRTFTSIFALYRNAKWVA